MLFCASLHSWASLLIQTNLSKEQLVLPLENYVQQFYSVESFCMLNYGFQKVLYTKKKHFYNFLIFIFLFGISFVIFFCFYLKKSL